MLDWRGARQPSGASPLLHDDTTWSASRDARQGLRALAPSPGSPAVMEELLLKVPAPFTGIEDLGFTARYPAQGWDEQLRDVPIVVEGPAPPMRLLVERLALFPERDRLVDISAEDEAYSWTAPVQLSDEVCVLAFRDHSLASRSTESPAIRSYVWNLVRPLAFTFLRDCVRIGGLRLADRIAVVIDPGHPPLVDLELRRASIVQENGNLLLWGSSA
jgi:hypothetical protein